MTGETLRRRQLHIGSGPANYVDTGGPDTAPARYLSRPSGRRITAIRPRRRATGARAR